MVLIFQVASRIKKINRGRFLQPPKIGHAWNCLDTDIALRLELISITYIHCIGNRIIHSSIEHGNISTPRNQHARKLLPRRTLLRITQWHQQHEANHHYPVRQQD